MTNFSEIGGRVYVDRICIDRVDINRIYDRVRNEAETQVRAFFGPDSSVWLIGPTLTSRRGVAHLSGGPIWAGMGRPGQA